MTVKELIEKLENAANENAEVMVNTEYGEMPKRSCENCGNAACANSIVAFYHDDCV